MAEHVGALLEHESLDIRKMPLEVTRALCQEDHDAGGVPPQTDHPEQRCWTFPVE